GRRYAKGGPALRKASGFGAWWTVCACLRTSLHDVCKPLPSDIQAAGRILSSRTKRGGSAMNKTWKPTAVELEAILVEMRPVIENFVERDRRRRRHSVVNA